MLTYEQAVHVLEGNLRMPPEWRELLQNNPLEFLKLYMRRHAVRIPFQNIEMAAVDQEKRWFPYEEDLINVGLAGRGGCCIHLNYFSKLVLQALGLESFVVRGDHYTAVTAGTHCILFVKLHSPPDQVGTYMVEVGGAYPMLEPVSMDKEKLPIKMLQAAGFPYEFREFAPGWIGKFHLKGGILGGAYTDKEETLRTSWDRKPRALWEFDYPMLETFTNPVASGLLKNPMMYRFFSNAEFRRLFPELPENAGFQKEKVLVTDIKRLSKFSKVLVAAGDKGKSSPEKKPLEVKKENREGGVRNGPKNEKSTAATTNSINNENTHYAFTATNEKQNGKANKSKIATETNGNKNSFNTSVKPVVTEEDDSEEEEYEVITEEEVSSEDEDDLEMPKNFIFVWKRRLVVGDAHSRKIVKNYSSYEEMAPDLKKYFPKIPPNAIDKALTNFSAFEPVPQMYDLIL